jgi:hypothetical protein
MAIRTLLTPSEMANASQGIAFNDPVSGRQAAIAAGIVASRIIDKPSAARDLHVRVGVAGTAGQTDVMVKKYPADGSAAVNMLSAALVVLNTATDPSRAISLAWVSEAIQKLEPGDVVTIEVTAAPTAGTNLDATLNVDQRFDDAVARPLLIGGGTP